MLTPLRHRLLDLFVLRPSRDPLPFEPKRREWIRTGTFEIECFVQTFGTDSEPDDASPPELLVIKFPGTSGRAERATELPCQFLPGIHTDVWTWNPPGYGRSSGRASLRTIPHAATDMVQSIIDRYDSPPTQIWLIGNSLGCVTSLHLAALNRFAISGLILRNPPPLIETVKRIAHTYPLGRLSNPVIESLVPEMNAKLTAAQTNVPTVMLQSERDQLVLPEFQMLIYDALAGDKRMHVMKGIDHGDPPSEHDFGEIGKLVRWLWERQSPVE